MRVDIIGSGGEGGGLVRRHVNQSRRTDPDCSRCLSVSNDVVLFVFFWFFFLQPMSVPLIDSERSVRFRFS